MSDARDQSGGGENETARRRRQTVQLLRILVVLLAVGLLLAVQTITDGPLSLKPDPPKCSDAITGDERPC